jgi:hypothetical protein
MSIKRFVSALLTGALCLGVLTACGSAQKPASSGVSADAQRYSTIFYDAFDTVTQVIAYCDSEEEFTRQMDALHADLLEYHRLYDIYNDYDGVVNVKTINDNAGVAPVQVDDKILGMLELARQMYGTPMRPSSVGNSSRRCRKFSIRPPAAPRRGRSKPTRRIFSKARCSAPIAAVACTGRETSARSPMMCTSTIV